MMMKEHLDSPINFTWVVIDEIAGMGWPKSRDQVSYLVEQGIDHLVTLSSDKIPPSYAFPELKWSLISVEDFSGPSMKEIQKFLEITDEVRRLGEAVGVHCAEGRGRTGVMCACYLIYYNDLKPWDAIRVMRRQRPGSVERKVQEDTVVRFHHLVTTFGKNCISNLEEAEKEWKIQQRHRAQDQCLFNCESVVQPIGQIASGGGVNELIHMYPSYNENNTIDAKLKRLQRISRSRSLPKSTKSEKSEEEEDFNFRRHIQNFYHEGRVRSSDTQRKTSMEKKPEQKQNENGRSPAKTLLNHLRPVRRGRRGGRITPFVPCGKVPLKASTRKPDALHESINTPKVENGSKNELQQHFNSFMEGSSVKLQRVRSMSHVRLVQEDSKANFVSTQDGVMNKRNNIRRKTLHTIDLGLGKTDILEESMKKDKKLSTESLDYTVQSASTSKIFLPFSYRTRKSTPDIIAVENEKVHSRRPSICVTVTTNETSVRERVESKASSKVDEGIVSVVRPHSPVIAKIYTAKAKKIFDSQKKMDSNIEKSTIPSQTNSKDVNFHFKLKQHARYEECVEMYNRPVNRTTINDARNNIHPDPTLLFLKLLKEQGNSTIPPTLSGKSQTKRVHQRSSMKVTNSRSLNMSSTTISPTITSSASSSVSSVCSSTLSSPSKETSKSSTSFVC